MGKKSFADTLAEKSFHSRKVQESWQAHMQAFGPILEPAFEEDYRARLELTAALNAISQGKLAQGFKKLQGMKEACVTDADQAAWLFCAGLCFEMEGNTGKMMSFYAAANAKEHRFYLPYIKVAKVAHQGAFFDEAEGNYRKAIECLGGAVWSGQMQPVVASVYTNLASCLTMMHRYEEAGEALAFSRRILPLQPGREATEAILYAAMKEENKLAESLAELERMVPAMVAEARTMTDKMLAGKHAHFAEQPMDEAKMEQFWQEFAANEAMLREKLAAKANEEVINWLSERLDPLFAFAERSMDFGILTDKDMHRLELADFYAVGLRSGFERLFEMRPRELDAHWQFAIVH